MPSREQTIKDHQERLNRVLEYIQDHLDQPLNLNELAKVACFSPFHFHRIFAAYVGESVSAHIRRVRLERAAHRLRHTKRSVTDIAFDAAYETSAAFNKAFRQYFKTTPSKFRTRKIPYYLKPRQLQLVITKETAMQPEIRIRSDKTILYVRRTGDYNKSSGEAWSAVCQFAFPRGLVGRDVEFIGISHDDPDITAEDKLRYDACITVEKDVKPEGEVGVMTLKGGRYAVFLHQGPYHELKATYRMIYKDWLPASGMKLRNSTEFEVYLNDPDRTKPENLKTEIFIPVE